MRLTESDSGFLYGETASGPLQTAGIVVLDGEVAFEDVYRFYESRIHLAPRFRHRLAWVPMNLAHPKWVDDPDFSLENHIVHHALPPGTSLEEAVDVATQLNEGLMDRNLPLWKFWVITGVENRTLLLQQIHHAMIDGASAVHLATVLNDYQPDAEPPPGPNEEWQPEPMPNAFELASEAMRENAQAMMQQNPMRAFDRGEEAQSLLRRGSDAMSRFFSRPAITAPWNAGLLGPKRKMRWSTYEFSDLKAIRRAFGGTINDVVLTVITEAAARYLVHHKETADGRYFRIMCPVNVRTEDEVGALGNRVSAMFPTIPAWSMDPIERLQVICEETSRIKESGEAQALTLMQESGFSVPPVALAGLQLIGTPFDPTVWMANNPPPIPPRLGTGPRPPFFGINFVCTNVPGVQVPQYIAGHEILENTGIMMMSGNMGLGVVVTSYNQRLLICCTCEPRLLPDLEFLVESIQGVVAELIDLTRGQNEPNTGEGA